jgi:hypothetical protein
MALTRKTWSIAIPVVLVAAVFVWLLFSSREERTTGGKEPPAGAEEPAEDEVEHTAEPAEIAPPAQPPRPSPAPRPSGERSGPGEVVGPGPDDPHEPGMLPHPLDEEHERIDTENRLIQRLNDAMSFRRVKEMREMLVEYRKLDPKDIDASQAGYEVIADCIEFPGNASLAAAHQFYDTERHSPLRRFVRRICFENSN